MMLSCKCFSHGSQNSSTYSIFSLCQNKYAQPAKQRISLIIKGKDKSWIPEWNIYNYERIGVILIILHNCKCRTVECRCRNCCIILLYLKWAEIKQKYHSISKTNHLLAPCHLLAFYPLQNSFLLKRIKNYSNASALNVISTSYY